MKNKIFAFCVFLTTVIIFSIPGVGAASDFVVLEDDGTLIVGKNENNKWLIDVAAIANKFYQANPDAYDFLAIYTDFPLGSLGSYVIKNNIKGIGLETYYGTDNFDRSADYGGVNKLLDISALDLSILLPENNYLEDRSLLLHELAHYWGIYVGGGLNLINVNAKGHYNPSGHMVFGETPSIVYWVDTGADTLGGQDVISNGDGTWRYVPPMGISSTRTSLSDLTLYLMGFKPAENVSPISLLKNVNDNSWTNITAEEQIITVQDIIREHGTRMPSYQNSQKDFSIAYILLTQKGQTPSAKSLKQVQDNLDSFSFYWAKKTRCVSTISTNLSRSNRQRCQPISSVNSSAEIYPNIALTNTNSAAVLTLTLKDSNGKALSNRSVRIIPDKESETTAVQVMNHFEELLVRFGEPYKYLTTDSAGQVKLPLYSSAPTTFSYFIVVDGEYLNFKPKVQFVNSLSTPIDNQPTTPTTPTPVVTPNPIPTISPIVQFIQQESSFVTQVDTSLVNRLNGYILLQVQNAGQAWYVDPISDLKYYLPDGTTAYTALRKFGLGITNADLAKIPIGIESRFQDVDTDGDGLPDKLEEAIGTNPRNPDTDGDGFLDGDEVKNGYNPLGAGKLSFDSAMVNRVKGRIVLQVQSRGEAWYINPQDGKRYYMKDGGAAYQIMRFLSLGITNTDLRKIPVGSL